MTPKPDEPPLPPPDFRSLLRMADWEKADFALIKAYICAIFSQYAYEHVPEFELPGTDRLKLIPCQSLKVQFQQNRANDVRRTLNAFEFAQVFVIETTRAIAVGVMTDEVIIIAIRGTVVYYCADWSINLNARKLTPRRVLSAGALHRGFYEATHDLCHKLEHKLLQWAEQTEGRPPVYVTGHSLGGAMSAILYGLWHRLLPKATKKNFLPLSAYTFGMPRYATQKAYEELRAPHHIYQPRDVVPHLPLRKMGFANNPFEYSLRDGSLVQVKDRERAFHGVKQHFIEGYRTKLGAILDKE